MLRTTSCVINVKTYLFCRRPRDFRISPISRLPPTNSVIDHRPRKPCPVSAPPPQPPVKDNRWLWGGLAVLVIAGCGIMCAHESPEVRDWLTLYAPWMDDFIAILYQENMTYGEIACQCLIEIKKYIATIKTDLEKRIYPEQNAIADVSRQARILQSDDDETVTTRR